MRVTVSIDDKLFARAVALAEPGLSKSELLVACVQSFVQRHTARRMAALDGQTADFESVSCHKDEEPTAS
jgi:hypothetical protein